MELAPDGRVFVCQQSGDVRVIKDGALMPSPFVSIATESSGERGLLGLALSPGFAINQFIFVYYTTGTPTVHNRVSRFTANGDVAVPGSEVVILELETLTEVRHNGGAIHFGPDGMLYVAVGDNTRAASAQSLDDRLGKILRIAEDGSIPTDNPYYATAAGDNRAIWAIGLRNPFTFAFEPGTGRMFINDVGESLVEEINEGFAGANYGWPLCEGACQSADELFEDPVFQYDHGSTLTTGRAITGGAFYSRANQFPAAYRGKYFFADTLSGWIRLYDPVTGEAALFASGLAGPVDLRVGPDGALYYLARVTASVGRISYGNDQPPLVIDRVGPDIIVRWSAADPAYRLETTSSLVDGSGWVPVAEPVTELNGERRIIISPSSPVRFLRLTKP
jgi:glucose/arabinose dehydrogenase